MVKIQFQDLTATVKDYKWTCDDKEAERDIQLISDTSKYKRPYGCFTSELLDNWIGEYIAEMFQGKVLSYNKVSPSPPLPPGSVY